MSIDSNRAECSDCGVELTVARTEQDSRLPCPACGSTRRNVFVSIVETTVARDGLAMKAKRPGQRKPYVESLSISSYSRSKGKVVHHERVIDRDNDQYMEKVTDYETGEVIHEKHEPLSSHVGHGSAKPKKSAGEA